MFDVLFLSHISFKNNVAHTSHNGGKVGFCLKSGLGIWNCHVSLQVWCSVSYALRSELMELEACCDVQGKRIL